MPAAECTCLTIVSGYGKGMTVTPRINELMRRGKEFSARRAVTLERKLENMKEQHSKGARLLGAGVLGPATAALTGFIETRYPSRNEQGEETLRSLGPVPLSFVFGSLALGAAYPDSTLSDELGFIAASQFGLFAGTWGRGEGVKSLTRTRTRRLQEATSPASTAGVGALRDYGGQTYQMGTPVGRRAAPASGDDEWTAEEASLLGL